jgi:putative membrane protein
MLNIDVSQRPTNSRASRMIEDELAIAISQVRWQGQFVQPDSFREKKSVIMNPYLLLAVTISFTLLSFINAPYRNELWLQHAPALVLLVAAALTIRFGLLSNASMLCIFAFLWLHILGARWIYSFVPYDQWSERLVGYSVSEFFGWTRNQYDRLVHLASGVLLVRPASEILQRYAGMRPLGAALVSIAMVLAIGAIYEILEWQIAITFSPRHAEAYNGQQGDVWDPQKDLALAWLGATLAAGLIWRSDLGTRAPETV